MILILQILFKNSKMKKMDQILKRKSVMRTQKIPDVSGLVKKADFNAKITEVKYLVLAV